MSEAADRPDNVVALSQGIKVCQSRVGTKSNPQSRELPLVARLVDSVDDTVAYVAGGATMINDVRAVLMAKGMARKAVKWEKFW